ncbi:histidinol-phosphate aminotransferase family protein [Patescibacteria group bacterium]|nr:histidinol-phosphate aminotransferase family protein [Patescibacteria group bacterium]MBU4477001.1 histidinol-phosphate aminotransferase family protein [Patescibacteria group bacterium]MCG2698828.1 histidinol-phosphate aminotransferase family protein [Candidatus Parcubacteria bacterium]
MTKANKQIIIDLRFGENPEAFLPAVRAVKEEAEKINKYPEPKREQLINYISKNEKINKENIYITNGIDGAINIVFSIYADKKSEIILPVPTFPDYEFSAKDLKYKIKKVPLEKDFSLDIDKVIKSITKSTKFIVIVNPNNPTGNQLINNKDLERILKSFKGLVIIDEIYFELTGETSIQLLNNYRNLILFRGFSKGYGLAGLRIGIIFANKKIIQKINETEGRSNKFIVNRLALRAAESVFLNLPLTREYINNFLNTKNEFENQISKIKGIQVLESKTSFSLFKLAKLSNNIPDKLKSKGILIKSTKVYENFPNNIMIIGVPKKEEIQYVYNSIKEIIQYG